MKYYLCVLLFACLPTWIQASPLPGASESTTVSEQKEATGYWQELNFWLVQQQRDFHRSLSAAMEELSEQASWENTSWLILVSFLYGVFHAAGPGHGKAVLTAYLVTQPEKLKRGLQLSFIASLLQGVTAIVLVTLLVHLLGRLAREAFHSVIYVEMLSFAVIALLGLGLVGLASRRLWRLSRSGRSKPAKVYSSPATAQPVLTPLRPAQGHALVTQPQVCPSCGKAHHVSPEQAATQGFWQTSGLLLSIGLRPCSGAVLVLVVANLLGLWWLGVAAVMAMAVGTSLTVMLLATLAVKVRDWAYRLLGLQGRMLSWLSLALSLLGGLLIFLLGVSLLLTVNEVQHPLGIV